jgi:serine/threonine protein kinase
MSDFKLGDYTYVRNIHNYDDPDEFFERVELWERRHGRITEFPYVIIQRFKSRGTLGSDLARRTADKVQQVLARVQHENVVKFICQIQQNGDPCLVFEYVPDSLYAIVTSPERRNLMTPAFRASITRQLVSALEHLHSIDNVRANIKLQNMRITADGKVKLLSILRSPAWSNSLDEVSYLRWRAPEMILEDAACDWRADIWTVGCFVYEISVFEPAFPIEEDWPWWDVLWSQVQVVGRLCQQHKDWIWLRVVLEARKGQRRSDGPLPAVAREAEILGTDRARGNLEEMMLSKGLGHECKRFITSCLQMCPHDRPTCQQLLQENFLTTQ